MAGNGFSAGWSSCANRLATYPAIFSFGDSLSDVGNAYIGSGLIGTPVPISPPYYAGRFSNGPNWLDDLSAKLELSMSPSFNIPPGNDFAVGGVDTRVTTLSTGSISRNEQVLIDLGDQAAFFITVHPSPNGRRAGHARHRRQCDLRSAVTQLEKRLNEFHRHDDDVLNEAVMNTVGAISDWTIH